MLEEHLRIREPERGNKFSPNAGQFWQTLLEETKGIQTPVTVFVGTRMASEENRGHNDIGVRWNTERVHKAIQETGGYPAFIRTEFTSSKHNYENAAIITEREEIDKTINKLIQEPVQRMIPIGCLMVRELLELDAYFTAFRGNLPIAPEIRCFISDGSVSCSHNYWEKDAINDPSVNNWKQCFDEINSTIESEKRVCEEYSELVAEKLTTKYGEKAPAMSVDFARTKGGDWIAIDMAEASRSYHPGDCPHTFE